MYEDDAWYDVTEWFDGNDYNPTEEQWFRWDDEVYDATAAANSSDTDNDGSDYGYANDKSTATGWYYDYDNSRYNDYGGYNTGGLYEFSSIYYDYDNDGYYDAYTRYRDTDGDGYYDDYAYMSFDSDNLNSTQADSAKKDAKSNQSPRSSKMFSVDGQVAATKNVKNRGEDHLVAHLTKDGQKVVVDLGAADRLDLKLQEGDQLTARGPVTKVGDKQVLLAREVEHDGKSIQIDRSPRHLSGTIVSTMKASPKKSGSIQHTMVKLKTNEGKHALVDLGPTEGMSTDLKDGQKLDVSGVAIKVKDRPVLFASKVTVDGKEMSIDRRGTHAKGDAQRTSRSGSQANN